MKKRVWAMLIVVCLTAGLFPAVSAAEVASGTCGENLTWVLTDDGTLTISGEGEMEDFETLLDDGTESPGAPWPKEMERIVIEEGVTSIGNYAFSGCGNSEVDDDGNYHDYLVVELPQSLTRIGDWAFLRSRGLREINVPDSVTELGEGAFCYSYLEQFKFPKGVSTVSKKLFFECRNLSEVILHDGITEIGESAFGYCTFETIEIPNSVTTIQSGAFCFNYCMTRVTFPRSVSYIANWALGYMDRMEEITILNPNCIIEDGMYYANPLASYGYYDNLSVATFYGYPGSTTQTYADAEGFDFIPLSPFTDVPEGSFYYDSVLWAVENGITSGTSDTTFSPNAECLRAQVVTFLWRAAGCPEPATSDNPFVDVKETDFFCKAVLWAVENGITNGADASHFNPYGICNRAQVVTFLHRAAGSPAPGSTELPFTDVPDGAWYAAPIAWAVEAGITNGLTANLFGPSANCNRAQIVTFLYRACN